MPGSIRSSSTSDGGDALIFASAAVPDAAVDHVPGLLQVVRDQIGDVLVVFDDEDVAHRGDCTRGTAESF